MNAPRTGGFTLLETVVVLVVLGLMLAILAGAAPSRSTRLDLANAADAVAGALWQARARAIAEDRPIIVTVPVGGSVLVIDGVARRLPDKVTLSLAGTLNGAPTGTAAIRFAADGSASAGTVRIVAGAQAMLVVVDWLTGRIAVTDAR